MSGEKVSCIQSVVLLALPSHRQVHVPSQWPYICTSSFLLCSSLLSFSDNIPLDFFHFGSNHIEHLMQPVNDCPVYHLWRAAWWWCTVATHILLVHMKTCWRCFVFYRKCNCSVMLSAVPCCSHCCLITFGPALINPLLNEREEPHVPWNPVNLNCLFELTLWCSVLITSLLWRLSLNQTVHNLSRFWLCLEFELLSIDCIILKYDAICIWQCNTASRFFGWRLLNAFMTFLAVDCYILYIFNNSWNKKAQISSALASEFREGTKHSH